MDSSFEGAALDPSKCGKMSIDQKRQLIYELSKQSHVASELLQSWSRQEILQILCAEMGKERKYTGLTKIKIIEALLKIVSEKSSGDGETTTESASPRSSKRQRKTDHPSRLSVPTNDASGTSNSTNGSGCINTIICKNLACRAMLRQENTFCKRCSCCICHQYDDNKDPSLWLTCSSEPPLEGDSCGMSCHLECALKHEKSGMGKDRRNAALDGSFYCVSCGKVNDLLGCWRKQLVVAKDTRRVDVLCYRLSLAQKLLKGTKRYQMLSDVVDEAVKKLEGEVGPLTGLPMQMGRGIVNRLQTGPEAQKLCTFAVEYQDKMLSESIIQSSAGPMTQDSITTGSTKVRFEDVRATSLAVVLGSDAPSPANIVHYSLWHRKATDKDYPEESTCSLFSPNARFVISGLNPATEYYFKVVSFNGIREMGMSEISVFTGSAEDEIENRSVMERSQSPATNCSSLSNPSSVEDESNNIATPFSDQIVDRADNYVAYCKKIEKDVPANLSNDCNKAVSSEPGSDVLKMGENCSTENQIIQEIIPDDGSDTLVQNNPVANNSLEANLPITPCRLDQIKNNSQARNGRLASGNKVSPETIENGSTSKKKGGNCGEYSTNGVSDSDFEHCVKVIRQLECSGHIEKNFRQKFLTWYSLRATPSEVRVVKVFIDTFTEDPAALAEQLVDTFSECISSIRSGVAVPAGFCMKLWH